MTDLLIPEKRGNNHEAQADAARGVPDDDCAYRVDMGGDFTRGAAGVVLEAGPSCGDVGETRPVVVDPLTYRITPQERRLLDERRRFHGVRGNLP